MRASDADVLDFHAANLEVRRLADAGLVASAGEVARRSESGLPDSLSRRCGEKSASALLAKRNGQSEAEAAEHCALGLGLTPREGFTGEILPSFFPEVADALAVGDLSAHAARTILSTLQKIERNVLGDVLTGLERYLVEGAVSIWSAQNLRDICRQLPDRFEPDGVELREKRVRGRRGITRRELEDGIVRYLIDADPESAAYIDAALDMRTAPRRQVRFVDAEPGDSEGDRDGDYNAPEDDVSSESAAREAGDADAITENDDRTWAQKRLDALVDIARDSLKHDDGDIGGVDTTAVLHFSPEAVADGTASAWFEGVDAPVSARTAERIMKHADIVGIVLDGDNQPLQLGRTRRFFNRAQRRAMAARDGGCVWPGCTAPPRWCDAAHVDPWAKGGATDIQNGVLLCHFHHRRFDEDGWTLTIEDNVPWFTPPSNIDAWKTPRRGGRAKLDMAGFSPPTRR
jgi:hypothetical protein